MRLTAITICIALLIGHVSNVYSQPSSTNKALEALDKALEKPTPPPSAPKPAPPPSKPSTGTRPQQASPAAGGPTNSDHDMETYLLKISSDAGVMNGPSKITTFNIKQMTRITKIWTYHFNGGQGRQPGTISLVNLDSGATVGTWQAVGTHHMFDSTPGSIWPSKGDGPPFLYWTAKPGIILAPGRYEVRDSDPASWSCNQETDNRGVAWVYGIVK